jgi:cytochrome c oxidase subunit 2
MLFFINADYAINWSKGFQDPASNTKYGIIDLHDSIIFYLIIFFFVVAWSFFSVATNKDYLPYLTEGNQIEVLWTVTPAIVLWCIAIPSLKLLYLIDEVLEPDLTVKAVGHSWYWSYELSDYAHLHNGESIAFDSFLIPEADLELGDLRQLTVDNYLVLPIHTSIRLLVTSLDVIHSFALPSFGIKADAVPGRLNSLAFIINRPGVFYGQCSELCGELHSAKPIGIKAVNLPAFLQYVDTWYE